jgi:hypothetical protein
MLHVTFCGNYLFDFLFLCIVRTVRGMPKHALMHVQLEIHGHPSYDSQKLENMFRFQDKEMNTNNIVVGHIHRLKECKVGTPLAYVFHHVRSLLHFDPTNLDK